MWSLFVRLTWPVIYDNDHIGSCNLLINKENVLFGSMSSSVAVNIRSIIPGFLSLTIAYNNAYERKLTGVSMLEDFCWLIRNGIVI